jgi:(p)ppGpp synthase/HD superfamily hydrolase
MTGPGYSDRVNHALAFAAKHHDQQVRKGTRLPYFTQPANVAIILTRYDCDEDTVVAGILHEVVADYLRNGHAAQLLVPRVAEKFGDQILATILMTVERRLDDADVELSPAERRQDVLRRLASASPPARWIACANAVHTAATLLADLRRTVEADAVWSRLAAGRGGTIEWYRRLHERLREVGFDAPIMAELGTVVAELEAQATLTA